MASLELFADIRVIPYALQPHAEQMLARCAQCNRY
jgi:hypothetical protein